LQVLKATLLAITKESELCHIILVSSDFGFLDFLEAPPAGRERCKRGALALLVAAGLLNETFSSFLACFGASPTQGHNALVDCMQGSQTSLLMCFL
jgi:hypothetical protein